MERPPDKMDVEDQILPSSSSLSDVLLCGEPGKLQEWLGLHSEHDVALLQQCFTKETPPDIEFQELDEEAKAHQVMQTTAAQLIGSTPLHYAVQQRRSQPHLLLDILRVVKNAALENFDWDVRNKEGYCPLSLAVSGDDGEAVTELVLAGADPNAIFSMAAKSKEWGQVPGIGAIMLSFAIASGAWTAFLALIHSGADVGKWGRNGMRAVHTAVLCGNLPALQLLLDRDGPPDDISPVRRRYLYDLREESKALVTSCDEGDDNDVDGDGDMRSVRSLANLLRTLREVLDSDEGEGHLRVSTQPSHAVHEMGTRQVQANSSEHQSEDERNGSVATAPSTEAEGESDASQEELIRSNATSEDVMVHAELNMSDTPAERTLSGKPQAAPNEMFGSGLLHLAVSAGKSEIVQWLLMNRERKGICSVTECRGDGASSLHLAAATGNVDVLRALVEVGNADPNVVNDVNSQTALHRACQNGHTASAQYLIAIGADVNASDIEGFRPIHFASGQTREGLPGSESVTMVDTLVQAGADVNARTLDGQTAMHLSVSRWNIDCFRKLLQLGGDAGIPHSDGSVCLGFIASNSMDELASFAAYIRDSPVARERMNLDISVGSTGQSALHIAAAAGASLAVENLLLAGAAPDLVDEEGRTPLLLAVSHTEHSVEKTCLRIIIRLIEAGANIHRKDNGGFDSLLHASVRGYATCVEYLMQKGANADARAKGKSALHYAALLNRDKVARALVQARSNFEATDSIGATSVMLCARHGSVETLKVLIEAGASLTHALPDGSTALHLCGAVPGKNDPFAMAEIVRSLCEAGVPLNSKNSVGNCAVHLFIEHRMLQSLRELLFYGGCDVEALSGKDQTPLMLACMSGDLRYIRLLLNAGADVNTKNSCGNTALFFFGGKCEEDSIRALSVLLGAGADINHVDGDGDTVLHEASLSDLDIIIAFVLSRGVGVDARNNLGETALFQACKKGHEDAVAALLAKPTSGLASANPRIPNYVRETPYQVAQMGGHDSITQLLLAAMDVTLSTFAPIFKYADESAPLPLESGSNSDRPRGTLCVFCQEELRFGEQLRKLPCQHFFHNNCILEWVGGEPLTRNLWCPVCRSKIAPESIATKGK